MIYAKKIEIEFDEKDSHILDGQSKICNWLYNQLLQATIEDYKNGNEKKLLSGRNLRMSLGKNELNKQVYVKGYLKEKFDLKENEKIKNFRLCKQQGSKFYAIFAVEKEGAPKKEVKSWMAIDQNHKNLFVAIDDEGTTFEFQKIYQVKYFDKLIDEVKSKRDLCNKNNKVKYSEHGNKYYLPSKRYLRLNKTLDKLYHKRREQIKLIMYSIANYIAKNYDKSIIGDYTPTLEVATDKNMHRGMINQSLIGMFRKILSWTMEKSNKTCVVVSEKDTTKTCCVCANVEKKDPSVREFTCISCNNTILRDVNSAINIARKDSLEPTKKNLNKILKKGYFRFDRYTLEGI